jgi:hypothetical protein
MVCVVVWMNQTLGKKPTELEADTEDKAVAWVEAFQFLMKSWASEYAERKLHKAKPEFGKELDACKEVHIKLTAEGDVFKKYPGRKAPASSATTRKLWIERTKKEEKICVCADVLCVVVACPPYLPGLSLSLCCASFCFAAVVMCSGVMWAQTKSKAICRWKTWCK